MARALRIEKEMGRRPDAGFALLERSPVEPLSQPPTRLPLAAEKQIDAFLTDKAKTMAFGKYVEIGELQDKIKTFGVGATEAAKVAPFYVAKLERDTLIKHALQNGVIGPAKARGMVNETFSALGLRPIKDVSESLCRVCAKFARPDARGLFDYDSMRRALNQVLRAHHAPAIAEQASTHLLTQLGFWRGSGVSPPEHQRIVNGTNSVLRPVNDAFWNDKQSIAFMSDFNQQVLTARAKIIARENKKESTRARAEERLPRPLSLTLEQLQARTERAFFQVVMARFAKLGFTFGRNWPRFAVQNESLDDERFFDNVADGRFLIDRFFEDKAHGPLPHMVGLLRMYEVLAASGTKLSPDSAGRLFADRIELNAQTWTWLHDVVDERNFSAPTVVTSMLDTIFPTGGRHAVAARRREIRQRRAARLANA